MPELTREEKLKLFDKLPPRLQELMTSEDTGAFLLYLQNKYNLSDEKLIVLSKLVADIVLGIAPITSLAQEINSKITSDAQAAMNLAQELNTELLAPVMASTPSTPTASIPAALKTTSPTPPYQGGGKGEVVDEYREPASSVPEVVDLRKAPPISAPAPTPQPKAGPPLAEKPIIPTPPPSISTPPAPIPKIQAVPLAPLIEAEPHRIPATEPRPQYIMRPSGAPPTDLPDNVLDLRKDKGEF